MALTPAVPVIETARLRLRPPAAEDFEAWAAFQADPVASRFLGGPQPRAVAWRSLVAMAGAWSLFGFGMFSVIEKARGRWLGRLGPWRPDGWPGAEIGWGASSPPPKASASPARARVRPSTGPAMCSAGMISFTASPPATTARKRSRGGWGRPRAAARDCHRRSTPKSRSGARRAATGARGSAADTRATFPAGAAQGRVGARPRYSRSTSRCTQVPYGGRNRPAGNSRRLPNTARACDSSRKPSSPW